MILTRSSLPSTMRKRGGLEKARMEVGVKVLIGVLRLETAKGVQANMKKRCLRLTIIWRRQCGTRYTIGEPTWNELPGISTHGRFGSADRGPWRLGAAVSDDKRKTPAGKAGVLRLVS